MAREPSASTLKENMTVNHAKLRFQSLYVELSKYDETNDILMFLSSYRIAKTAQKSCPEIVLVINTAVGHFKKLGCAVLNFIIR